MGNDNDCSQRRHVQTDDASIATIFHKHVQDGAKALSCDGLRRKKSQIAEKEGTARGGEVPNTASFMADRERFKTKAQHLGGPGIFENFLRTNLMNT